MSYVGELGQRRVWTGLPGVDLRIRAMRRSDRTHDVEISYVSSGEGKPVADYTSRMPVTTAFEVAGMVQGVLAEATERIENDGDRDDRDEHVYAERWWRDADGLWSRVIVFGEFGEIYLYVNWGIETEEGRASAYEPLVMLPFARALELPSALTGAALIAFAMNDLEPITRHRTDRQVASER